MIFFLTHLASWMLYTFVLSAAVFFVYLYLKRANLSSVKLYLFLKVSFLSLPIFYLCSILDWSLIFEFFKKSDQALVPMEILSSAERVTAIAKSHFVTKPKVDIYYSWVILGFLFLSLGLSLFRFMGLLLSWLELNRIRSSAILLCKKMGIKVFLHEHEVSPCAFGIFNPCILISKTTFTSLTEEEWETIFLHEQLHIRRFDPLLNFLRLIVQYCFILNPFFSKLSNAFEEEMELSIDQIIVSQKNVAKKFYGQLLFKIQMMTLQPSTSMHSRGTCGFFKRRLHQLQKNEFSLNDSGFAHIKALIAIVTLVALLPTFSLGGFLDFNIPNFSIFSTEDSLKESCETGKCPKEVVELFQRAVAEKAEDQYILARAFLVGDLLSKDREKALFWFHRSYENGNGDAANEIASLYSDNFEEAKEEDELCDWFKRAADLGSRNGIYNLANCYYYGYGRFPKDKIKAKQLKGEIGFDMRFRQSDKYSGENDKFNYWDYRYDGKTTIGSYP